MLNLILNSSKYNVLEEQIEFGFHEVNENEMRIFIAVSSIGLLKTKIQWWLSWAAK